MAVVYPIDLNAPDYEIWALVVATVAFPEASAHKRESLIRSLCSWHIRHRAKADPDWSIGLQPIRPIYLAHPEAVMVSDMRTLERRLCDRLTAGHMVVAFLKEAESGEIPSLPAPALRLSINELCKTVTEDRGIECPGNVESRVWRLSFSVLHLCAALAVYLQERHRTEEGMPKIAAWATDPELIATVLVRAVYYEGLLAKSRLRIDPERLIQLRPVVGPGFKKIA